MSEIETITPPGNAAAELPPLADVLPQDDPTAKPAKPAKPAKARDISGLVLVDIPAHGLKCGDYVTLPAATAKGLQASGEFDAQAPRPE